MVLLLWQETVLDARKICGKMHNKCLGYGWTSTKHVPWYSSIARQGMETNSRREIRASQRTTRQPAGAFIQAILRNFEFHFSLQFKVKITLIVVSTSTGSPFSLKG